MPSELRHFHVAGLMSLSCCVSSLICDFWIWEIDLRSTRSSLSSSYSSTCEVEILLKLRKFWANFELLPFDRTFQAAHRIELAFLPVFPGTLRSIWFDQQPGTKVSWKIRKLKLFWIFTFSNSVVKLLISFDKKFRSVCSRWISHCNCWTSPSRCFSTDWRPSMSGADDCTTPPYWLL